MHNKVKITSIKYIHQFGRSVAHSTVLNEETDEVLFTGTLNSSLHFCQQHKFEVVNAQEVLHRLVAKDGHAS